MWLPSHSGEDPDILVKDNHKSKYSIRTVKLLQVTLIKQSNTVIILKGTSQVFLQKPLK